MGIVLGSSFITTMSQFDPFLCDPQVEDLIPAGLDDLLQEIYEDFDYDELGDIPPAEDLYDPDEEYDVDCDSEGCWIIR
jgi:hypothetical protein